MSPTKTIRSIFHLSSLRSKHRHEKPRDKAPELKRQLSVSSAKIEEDIQKAEEIIAKWDPEASAYAKITSIFYENRMEAEQFLRTVEDLQHSMQSIMANSGGSGAQFILRCQTLMKSAMHCLKKEFHQILSANRDRLDPESITASERSSRSLNSRSSTSDHEEDETHTGNERVNEVDGVSVLAMADLKAIAECMISCGYGKECVDIYKSIRRSIVDEGLYKLGFDNLSPLQIQKLDWDVLGLRIRNWLSASKVVVRTLFAGERALCDHVFASSSSIRESIFADIARDPAIFFLGFPELVAQKTKVTPEKVFRLLRMYTSIFDLLPAIECVFSQDSTAAVRTQATSSLSRLAKAVRSLIADFEGTIQKDASKAPVSGGGVHPLTEYTMNYLIFLADYGDVIADIYIDQPLQAPSSLPEPLFDAAAGSSAPPSPAHRGGESFIPTVSSRFAWLLFVLLCKLDSKAEAYRDIALAYLFLANNLNYVLNKVRTSPLRDVLGEDWVLKNESKVRSYTGSYVRLAWGKVIAAVTPSAATQPNAEAAREALQQFNAAFPNAIKQQTSWIVPDDRLRDELKLSLSSKLVPAYKNLHQAAEKMLRGEKDLDSIFQFTPNDVSDSLSELFNGDAPLAAKAVASAVALADSLKRPRFLSLPPPSPKAILAITWKS